LTPRNFLVEPLPLMLTDPPKTVFIYALKEPDTGEIRYVGKAADPNRRFINHFFDGEVNHRTNWIKSLVNRGAVPVLEILDEVPEEYWQQWEVAWIEFYRESGANLTNGTFGGDGVFDPSGEIRRKISKALTGKKLSAQHRKRISEVNLGKSISPEHRRKISETLKGICKSEETRRKMSKPKSEETRKKMSKPKSEETRRRMSIARRLRDVS
jgi:hypothetical protein